MSTEPALNKLNLCNAQFHTEHQIPIHSTEKTLDIELDSAENERRRVAKELHDEILPLLARLSRSLQTELCDRPEYTKPLANDVHKAVADLRDLLGELHPVDLEELGLIPALSNICNRCVRLTGLCVLFIEHIDEFPLSQLQQLCIYRAIQTVLQMFCKSENDILLLNANQIDDICYITVRCVDKRVSSAEWLSVENPEFTSFAKWCRLAGAEITLGANVGSEFPCDLVITVSTKQDHETQSGWSGSASVPAGSRRSQARERADASELTNVKANRLLQALAIQDERHRITNEILRLIIPHFRKIHGALLLAPDEIIGLALTAQLAQIEDALRGIISETHLAFLSEAGIVSSIQILLNHFRSASGMTVTLKATEPLSGLFLSLESKFAIYRVVQEALNNIEKHAEASQAEVTLRLNNNQFLILIEDNGKGFQKKRRTQSRGLKNIRERAASIGASVSWEQSSSFESGTLVTIILEQETK